MFHCVCQASRPVATCGSLLRGHPSGWGFLMPLFLTAPSQPGGCSSPQTPRLPALDQGSWASLCPPSLPREAVQPRGPWRLLTLAKQCCSSRGALQGVPAWRGLDVLMKLIAEGRIPRPPPPPAWDLWRDPRAFCPLRGGSQIPRRVRSLARGQSPRTTLFLIFPPHPLCIPHRLAPSYRLVPSPI